MDRKINLLIVSESEAGASDSAQAFSDLGYDVSFKRCSNYPAIQTALSGGEWDLLLLEGRSNGCKHHEVIRLVDEARQDLPVLRIPAAGDPGPDTKTTRNLLASLVSVPTDNEAPGGDKQNTHLAKAVEMAAETVVVTDANGVIQYVNPAFEQITGYRRDEVIGRKPNVLKSGVQNQPFYQSLWDTIRNGETWRGNLTNRRKDNTLFKEEAVISPVRNSSGAVTNFVAVKRDTTRETALQHQLLQSQKMQAIGKLAGGIAHDFNNLLMVILNSGYFIQEEVSLSPRAQADMEEITKAANRAATLTRQLLAFSRQQILSPELIQTNEIVSGIEKMLKRVIGEDIKLTVIPSQTAGSVEVDPSQIEQVLMNLAVNARDAMPLGGDLTITTESTLLRQEDVTHFVDSPDEPEGRFSVITLTDTGCGMTPKVQDQVFEPFYTTKNRGQGTGLGLSTAYGIVKQHGGYFSLYSEPGRGSSFKIYLPAAGPDAEPAQPSKPAQPDDLTGSETVLVVEDDPEVRKILSRIVRDLGYTVLQAGNSDDAKCLVREYASPIHLLLSDVVLPGSDGKTMSDELKRIRPDLKVIFASGYPEGHLLKHGVLPENVVLLRKPFDRTEVARKIRDKLDE